MDLNVLGILVDNDSYLKIVKRNFILYSVIVLNFFLLNQKHAFDI